MSRFAVKMIEGPELRNDYFCKDVEGVIGMSRSTAKISKRAWPCHNFLLRGCDLDVAQRQKAGEDEAWAALLGGTLTSTFHRIGDDFVKIVTEAEWKKRYYYAKQEMPTSCGAHSLKEDSSSRRRELSQQRSWAGSEQQKLVEGVPTCCDAAREQSQLICRDFDMSRAKLIRAISKTILKSIAVGYF